MIDVDTVRRLFAYTDWANERIAGALQAVSAEQFTRALGGSFGSIAETVAHMIGAEWVWLQRWRGMNPTAAPDWTHSSDLDVLLGHMRQIRHERAQWTAALTPGQLAATLHGKRITGEPISIALSDALLHVANHSTYHRGQIATMLRQVGSAAPSTDFSAYVRERSGNG